MVLEFLLRISGGSGSPTEARRMLDATLEAMARGGIHDQLGGGFARYSVDAAWVVPHFEKMLYDNALLLRRVRRVGDRPRRAGPPRASPTSCSASCARPRAGSPPRWTPTPRAPRAPTTSGRRRSWSRCSGPTTAPGRPAAVGHGGRHLRARHLDPPAARRPGRPRSAGTGPSGCSGRSRPPGAPGPRRQGRRRLERPGDQRPVPRRTAARPADVRQGRRGGRRLLWRVHVVDGRLRRVSRDGVVGAPAGVLEDHGCVASGFLDLLQATGDAVWLERAGVLLDAALERFRADDGGFFDTADDAEALVARPRDPSDNASPSGLSSLVHALVDVRRAHRLGPAPRRRRGGARDRRGARRAGAAVRRLVAGRRRRRCSTGRSRSRSSARPVAERDALERRARRHPGAVVVVADGPDDEIPLLVGRTPVDGRPAAYVCRGFVCERPVTTVEELERPCRGDRDSTTVTVMTQAPARPQSGSTFESLNPATGEVVGTHPVQTEEEVRAAVARAREEAVWWAGLSFGERKAHLNAWKTAMTQRLPELAELVRHEMGKPVGDAMLEAGLAIDHIAWAAGHAKQGARSAQGVVRAADGQPVRVRGVQAARRRRRDRPVELPGLHADGLDRLRAGRRQRRRLQAERVHPRRRRLARCRPSRRPSVARSSSWSPASARPGRAVPRRRRQARVHRLDGDRQEGDGRLRRDPDARS